METLRGNNPVDWNNNKELKLQLIDLLGSNNDIETEDQKGIKKIEKKFVIRAFGVTEEGYSVCLNITEFPPHFYVKVDFNMSQIQVKEFISYIKSQLSFYNKSDIISYDVVHKKDVWGFNNNKKFNFIRILFKNTNTMNDVVKILKKNKIRGKSYKDSIYESNILPLVRFIHINKIEPSNWIILKPNSYEVNDEPISTCQIDVDVHWKKVIALNSQKMSPFIKLSFDIECDSQHGDFPLAKKDYKKLASDLYDNIDHNNHDNQNNSIKRIIGSAFSMKNIEPLEDINKVYTKDNATITPLILNKISSYVDKVINRQLSYKILAENIICNYNDNPNSIVFNKERVTLLICDAFCDEYIDKENHNIEMLYTKVNRKPSKKVIDFTSANINKLYEKLYNKIQNKLLDCNDETMFKFFSHYEHLWEINDFDEKIKYMKENLDISIDNLKETLHYIDFICNQMISIFKKYFPDIDNSRDTYVKRINNILSEVLPPLEGDKVIQIGSCVQIHGQKDMYMKHIITLDTCDPIEGAIVESYKTEAEVLLAWTRFIQQLDPDIITGYNIFGFDYAFMWGRAEELGIDDDFSELGRLYDVLSKLEIKKLSSSALGDNTLQYINMEGRVQMDLLKVIQRDHNLASYKLDHVAETFMNDSITNIETIENQTLLKINGHKNINIGNFITLNVNGEQYNDGQKFKISNINKDIITINDNINDLNNSIKGVKWQLAKDDVSPKEIFEFQKQGPDKRQIVATYCIQDCALCLNIIDKLNIITNNMGMSNVCTVPLSFIFLRGQGIKIFSLISRECRKNDFLIPVIKHTKEETRLKYSRNDIYKDISFVPEEDDDAIIDNDGGYEGAIVLKPKPDIYLKKPVTVLDYASLYPSSMISENLSFDSIIMDEDTQYLGEEGSKHLDKLGYNYNDITHDVFKWIDPKIRSKGKVKVGTKTCRFVQHKDGSKGIVPTTLRFLLTARKETRTKAKYKVIETQDGEKYEGLLEQGETETIVKRVDKTKDIINNEDIVKVYDRYSEDEQAVLDGYQLAFKMTANSTYGQIGAITSSINFKEIAASTTAVGRELLHLAKNKVLENFDGAEIVYGDTDSIFINFNPKDDEGNLLENKAALKKSIELGVKAEEYIQDFLKPPHKLEYEKTFMPFILFSKKRYIGYKYEFDLDKYKETSMGIVLKRRDNANIVKHIYGGIINIIMKEQNLEKSIKFCQKELGELLKGKFNHKMLVITKSLRGYYKNPNQIAHKVLADRIGVREPGNKPQATDRIPYIYIENDKAKLQGDKIETPDFIKENKLKIDYKYYITNQIMKPVCQIYALALEQLEDYKLGEDYFDKKYQYLLSKNDGNDKKTNNKIDQLRNEEVVKIVFSDVLRVAENKKNKVKEINHYFKKS